MSALFVVSSVLKKRVGGIMLVAGNQELPPLPPEEHARRMDLGPLIRTAIEAGKIVIEKDRAASG